MNRKKVVVIGGGFAGLCAIAALRKTHDVILVDQQKHFEWSPNIHEIISGIKRGRDVSLNLPGLCEAAGHRFVCDRVVDIRPAENAVLLEQTGELHYDALLIALGQTTSFHGIQGASEHAMPFKRIAEAQAVRDRLAQRLSTGQATTVSVVGGGFTGIEVVGEILRKYQVGDLLSLRLIESAECLLNGLPESVGDHVAELCREQGVDLELGARIAGVSADSVTLGDGRRLPSNITIWTAGTGLPEVLQCSPLALSGSRGIVVNEHLQSPGAANIFVAGDAAAFPRTLARQAYFAMEMGRHAASNINRLFAGRKLKAYQSEVSPVLLSFGHLNTYFIVGNKVVSSPLLAAAKDSIYQLQMARLSKRLPTLKLGRALCERQFRVFQKFYFPEVRKAKLADVLAYSRVWV